MNEDTITRWGLSEGLPAQLGQQRFARLHNRRRRARRDQLSQLSKVEIINTPLLPRRRLTDWFRNSVGRRNDLPWDEGSGQSKRTEQQAETWFKQTGREKPSPTGDQQERQRRQRGEGQTPD